MEDAVESKEIRLICHIDPAELPRHLFPNGLADLPTVLELRGFAATTILSGLRAGERHLPQEVSTPAEDGGPEVR